MSTTYPVRVGKASAPTSCFAGSLVECYTSRPRTTPFLLVKSAFRFPNRFRIENFSFSFAFSPSHQIAGEKVQISAHSLETQRRVCSLAIGRTHGCRRQRRLPSLVSTAPRTGGDCRVTLPAFLPTRDSPSTPAYRSRRKTNAHRGARGESQGTGRCCEQLHLRLGPVIF